MLVQSCTFIINHNSTYFEGENGAILHFYHRSKANSSVSCLSHTWCCFPKCVAADYMDAGEWDCDTVFSFPLKQIVLNSDWITKTQILCKLNTILSNTKSIWNSHKSTKVMWTTGEKICLGIFPGLWILVVWASRNDDHRGLIWGLDILDHQQLKLERALVGYFRKRLSF